MKLQIICIPEKRYKVYLLDGIGTIGVEKGENFSIEICNNLKEKVQVKLSIDGVAFSTRKNVHLADLGLEDDMWILEAGSKMKATAWPESSTGGASFVFGDETVSVAGCLLPESPSRGYISVAVFKETKPPHIWKGTDGKWALPPDLEEAFRNAPIASSAGFVTEAQLKSLSYKGAGVGAGAYTAQKIGKAQGLHKPEFSEIIQIRYMWWEELLPRLQATAQLHPTGFLPAPEDKMMDLGDVPRQCAPPVPERIVDLQFARFEEAVI